MPTRQFFVYRVVPQDRPKKGEPPVTAWAGPAAVLCLPRGLTVEVFRRDALVPDGAWQPCGRCAVGAAGTLAGL